MTTRIQRKCPHEVFKDEVDRLERIVDETNGQYTRLQKINALIELGHMHQRSLHQCWKYLHQAQDLARGH